MLISKDNTILKHAKRYTRQTDYETLTAKQTNAACASLPIISTMSKNKKSSPTIKFRSNNQLMPEAVYTSVLVIMSNPLFNLFEKKKFSF